jgi:hypothetical protein
VIGRERFLNQLRIQNVCAIQMYYIPPSSTRLVLLRRTYVRWLIGARVFCPARVQCMERLVYRHNVGEMVCTCRLIPSSSFEPAIGYFLHFIESSCSSRLRVQSSRSRMGVSGRGRRCHLTLPVWCTARPLLRIAHCKSQLR